VITAGIHRNIEETVRINVNTENARLSDRGNSAGGQPLLHEKTGRAVAAAGVPGQATVRPAVLRCN